MRGRELDARTWISALIAALLTWALIVTLGGCSTDAQPDMSDGGRFEVIAEEWTNVQTYVLEDSETGVQYLVVSGSYKVSVTPLLDADGKPYVAHREFDQGEEAQHDEA